MSLRAELPDLSRPELAAEAAAADALIQSLGLDVPCSLSRPSRLLLFMVVRAMGARTVLDIGTYCGTSAVLFALAVGAGGRVVSVDLRDVNGPTAYWSQVPGARPPCEVLERAGLTERVEFVTMDSAEFMSSTFHHFDFISIDGWHEAFAVYADILLALPLVNPEGLIFLDDVQLPGQPRPPGINRIRGPFRALGWHEHRGTGFRVHYNDVSPTAFLLRAV